MTRQLLIAFVITAVASVHAWASGPYISASGGASLLELEDRNSNANVHDDKGFNGEGAVGFAFCSDASDAGLRLELAYSYSENEIEDVDVETSAIMANGYVDMYTETSITPYLLIGIGRAEVDDGSYDKAKIAYQAGAGIGYSITDNIVADLKYKYMRSDHDNIDVRLYMQQIQFGLRFMF